MKKILESEKFQKIKNFYFKYERHIGAGALLFGFILDNITLQRIDDTFEDTLMIFYLLLAGLIIFLINLYKREQLKNNFLQTIGPFLPTFLQFAFGGLFSGFFIFYSRSGDITASWPFILILLFLLLGNEFFRKQYVKTTFQVSIYFLAIYSFLIFFIPIILKQISILTFVLSGIFSVIFIRLFILLLDRGLEGEEEKSWTSTFLSIGALFILINVLYFTNYIPPIPLSLKDAGLYHYIERTETGDYFLKKEKEGFLGRATPGRVVHLKSDQPLYFFTSVFAPTDISEEILHCWDYKENGEWVNSSCISFPIYGGANRGYRGYSVKTRIWEGDWRVSVENKRGQVIDRIGFKVEEVKKTPELESITK